MINFFISMIIDLILILISYFIFKFIINGSTRHKLYEKFLSSFGKFVIYIFIITILITGFSALLLYRTRHVIYLNIIAPAIVSIFVGFLISLVPSRGIDDANDKHDDM